MNSDHSVKVFVMKDVTKTNSQGIQLSERAFEAFRGFQNGLIFALLLFLRDKKFFRISSVIIMENSVGEKSYYAFLLAFRKHVKCENFLLVKL